MSRMRFAGLVLIGLAACSTSKPNRQARSTAASRESTTATASHAPARSSTQRTTTTSKQPVRRTTTHPDTVANAANPLTNH